MARTKLAGRTNQAGFSFVELLIAMIVLALLAALAIPAFMGQREKANDATAKSLVRSAATTMEAASVDTQGYVGLDATALANEDGNITWLDGPGAMATDDQVSIEGVSSTGYTLTSTSPSGQVFVYTKDLATQPTVTLTCGAGCTW